MNKNSTLFLFTESTIVYISNGGNDGERGICWQRGKRYFHSEWFPTVKEAVQKQTGFISITSRDDETDPALVHITLKFDNDKNLQAWVSTKIHGQVIDLLDPYRTRDWLWSVVEVMQGEEEPKLTKLVWETAVPKTVAYERTPFADASTEQKATVSDTLDASLWNKSADDTAELSDSRADCETGKKPHFLSSVRSQNLQLRFL